MLFLISAPVESNTNNSNQLELIAESALTSPPRMSQDYCQTDETCRSNDAKPRSQREVNHWKQSLGTPVPTIPSHASSNLGPVRSEWVASRAHVGSSSSDHKRQHSVHGIVEADSIMSYARYHLTPGCCQSPFPAASTSVKPSIATSRFYSCVVVNEHCDDSDDEALSGEQLHFSQARVIMASFSIDISIVWNQM